PNQHEFRGIMRPQIATPRWTPLLTLSCWLMLNSWLAPDKARAATWPAHAPHSAQSTPGTSTAPGVKTRYKTNGFTHPVTNFPVQMVFLGDAPPGMQPAEVERAAQ